MPAAADLCPSTGRARLSYRRAEELFCAASGGWTLHQLRHSALTHLAEADVWLDAGFAPPSRPKGAAQRSEAAPYPSQPDHYDVIDTGHRPLAQIGGA